PGRRRAWSGDEAEARAVELRVARAEATEGDGARQLGAAQPLADGLHGYVAGLLLGVAVDAGGDGREGDRLEPGLLGEAQRLGVAGAQLRRLAAAAVAVDRPHGVDHVAGRQAVTAGDARLAGGSAVQALALLQQLRPGGAVDGAVDAAAADQRV